jgi:hypothetical protein
METLECWQPDPSGRHQFRYFSKGRSTSWVSDGLQVSHDGRPWSPQAPSPAEVTSAQSKMPFSPPVPDETDSVRSERPAGWYQNASNPAEVRFWDGATWTDNRNGSPSVTRPLSGASRVGQTAPGPSPALPPVDATPSTETPAGWYPDPSDATRLRHWDGSGWTTEVKGETPPSVTATSDSQPSPGLAIHTLASADPPGWYADPHDTDVQQYWNGSRWTHRMTPLSGAPDPLARPTSEWQPADAASNY